MLGGPHAVRITPELVDDDQELRLFVTQEAGHRVYHWVSLTLNFPELPGTPALSSVHLGIDLAAPGGGEEPVAWRMRPLQEADVRLRERRFGLSSGLGIVDVGQTGTSEIPVPTLRGEGEQTPRARWRFTRTPTRPLVGDHRLALVVRAPTGVTTTLSLEINATTRTRHLRRYLDLPTPLTLDSPFPLA
jgi:hypothetical protein